MSETHEQFQVRLGKRDKLLESNINPYRDRFEQTHSLVEGSQLPDGTSPVSIAGRLISVRSFGKLIFGHLQDLEGRLQIALEKKQVGLELFTFFKEYIDIGDFLGLTGKVFTTRTGEKTVAVENYTLLSKTMRPLPEKWHGLTDIETRYRQRYLDFIHNREVGQRFLIRAKIMKTIRFFLEKHCFVEVETPVLQTTPSGALAIPFVTHYRALNMDCYLRIAPETYLKRCIAGGFERVYEFAKSFRNEGMDPSHLQEFTLLEYYAAYWNYEDNMSFTEELVKHLIQEINGSLTLKFKDQEIDFSGTWPRKSLRDLLLKDCDIDIDLYRTAASLKERILRTKIELEGIEKVGRGKMIDLLYKKVTRPKISDPLFLIHHPIDLSPLARKNDENPLITDRFQLIVHGWELVNAYSELIDPIDQRERFVEQAKLKEKGDEEALPMDEDYLLCMEHGMPPISGWGMGLDRVVCLLIGQENLRESILFPLLKPKS